MLLFNLADLNIPALLFVSREERGRARLTIGPIGRIFMLAVQVTTRRIYVFCIRIVDRASKSGARSQNPVPSTRAHSPKGKTLSLETRNIQRARSQEPVTPQKNRQIPHLGKTKPSR